MTDIACEVLGRTLIALMVLSALGALAYCVYLLSTH
jgi:hypothetical protein